MKQNDNTLRVWSRHVTAICSAMVLTFSSATVYTAKAQLYAPAGQLTSVITADGEDIVEADTSIAPVLAPDPWEGMNRDFFAVNIFLDDNVLIPASKGYRAVTPKVARRGIRNFLSNVRSPGIFANDLLQGEIGRAGDTLSRFIINSTIGFLGFADPAAKIGIAKHSEDFGQTMAVWGVPSGPYTFLPFFGPGTVRSNIGSLVQLAFNPLIYFDSKPVEIARYSTVGVGLLSTREPLIEPLQEIREGSLDYYASLRSFYQQARKREIENGRTSFDDLPDITEFEDFDDLE